MDRYIIDYKDKAVQTNMVNSMEGFKLLLGQQIQKPALTILHYNVHSILMNIDEVLHNLDILVFSETWQMPDVDLYHNLYGYKAIYDHG